MAGNPAFDADEYRAALTRPALRIDNVTYHGVILSIEEWMPFEDQLADVLAGDDRTATKGRAFAAALLRALFPRSAIPRWLRWRHPVERALALPWEAVRDMTVSFVQAQRRANRIQTTRPTPAAGPDSSS